MYTNAVSASAQRQHTRQYTQLTHKERLNSSCGLKRSLTTDEACWKKKKIDLRLEFTVRDLYGTMSSLQCHLKATFQVQLKQLVPRIWWNALCFMDWPRSEQILGSDWCSLVAAVTAPPTLFRSASVALPNQELMPEVKKTLSKCLKQCSAEMKRSQRQRIFRPAVFFFFYDGFFMWIPL